jgi:hypothetical protein
MSRPLSVGEGADMTQQWGQQDQQYNKPTG